MIELTKKLEYVLPKRDTRKWALYKKLEIILLKIVNDRCQVYENFNLFDVFSQSTNASILFPLWEGLVGAKYLLKLLEQSTLAHIPNLTPSQLVTLLGELGTPIGLNRLISVFNLPLEWQMWLDSKEGLDITNSALTENEQAKTIVFNFIDTGWFAGDTDSSEYKRRTELILPVLKEIIPIGFSIIFEKSLRVSLKHGVSTGSYMYGESWYEVKK